MESYNKFYSRPSDADIDQEEGRGREDHHSRKDFEERGERRTRESGRSERGNRPQRKTYGDSSDRRGGREQFSRSNPRNDNEPRREKREEPLENIIFGLHPVREAIQSGRQIEKIYFRRDNPSDSKRYMHQPTPDFAALDQIRSMILGTNIFAQDVPPEKLDKLCRRGNHQGVVAVTPAIEYMPFEKLLDKVASAEIAPLIIAVDNVTDVGNFGAIARSAECAGADAILMSAKNSAPVNADAIRSSAGALNVIPVSRVGGLRHSLAMLQAEGVQIVAATEKSHDLLFDTDLTKPTVIVVGSEDRGVSSEILKLCDSRVAIPMLGKIESMNVSAAAAVMMFEAVRQRYMATE